jgi:cysteinyl-tRNA synthetase
MTITQEDLKNLQQLYSQLVYDVLGLQPSGDSIENGNGELLGQVVELLLTLRQEAKAKKEWATSDQIRDRLTALGFEIKDTKEGADWKIKN